MRVGINGAGRIGRALIRLLHERDDLQLAAINDIAGAEVVAALLRHDSIHGHFPAPVVTETNAIAIDDRLVPVTTVDRPAHEIWSEHGVELVVEATGHFTGPAARGHLGGGVERVVVTAVSDHADRVCVSAVDGWRAGEPPALAPAEKMVSTASCTTHAAAVPLTVVDDAFGVEAAEMTTVHCTTGSQPTIDRPHNDLRRARSAMLSMIPTTTSAQRGLTLALPHLSGKLTCLAIRVPTTTVSLVELVMQTKQALPDLGSVQRTFVERAEGDLRGLLECTDQPLVSIDFSGNAHSAIVDLPLIAAPSDRLLRVIAWYDNEWGYANRVLDLVAACTRG